MRKEDEDIILELLKGSDQKACITVRDSVL